VDVEKCSNVRVFWLRCFSITSSTALIFTDKSGRKLISVGYRGISIFDNGTLKSRIWYSDFVKESASYDSLGNNFDVNYIFPSCSIRDYFSSTKKSRKFFAL
jgi:hypothetical protein